MNFRGLPAAFYRLGDLGGEPGREVFGQPGGFADRRRQRRRAAVRPPPGQPQQRIVADNLERRAVLRGRLRLPQQEQLPQRRQLPGFQLLGAFHPHKPLFRRRWRLIAHLLRFATFLQRPVHPPGGPQPLLQRQGQAGQIAHIVGGVFQSGGGKRARAPVGGLQPLALGDFHAQNAVEQRAQVGFRHPQQPGGDLRIEQRIAAERIIAVQPFQVIDRRVNHFQNRRVYQYFPQPRQVGHRQRVEDDHISLRSAKLNQADLRTIGVLVVGFGVQRQKGLRRQLGGGPFPVILRIDEAHIVQTPLPPASLGDYRNAARQCNIMRDAGAYPAPPGGRNRGRRRDAIIAGAIFGKQRRR